MSSLLPTETQILIVGAGPSGLASAISLVCNGIEPSKLTIVDVVEKGANTSRALAIHSATLEALDAYGCASKLIELGNKATTWAVNDRASNIIKTSFSHNSPHTKFPFALILAQTATEHVLEERLRELGVRVLRPYRVTGMKENVDGKGMDVLFESGEVVGSDYVIGADGARSTVRQLSGIHFADPDGEVFEESTDDRVAQMVLADVSLSVDEDALPGGVGMTVSNTGMFLVIPLGKPAVGEMLYNSSEAVYRISFNVPRILGEAPSHASLEFLQTNMNQRGSLCLSSDPTVNPNPVHITKVHWSSRYRTHSAIADVFFKRIHGGSVFLVGDAAHIHSPAGGQGMNLGIRDGAGLGPILAEHIREKGSAKERSLHGEENTSALEHYAALRRMRGLGNIKLTKDMMGGISYMMKPHLFNWPRRALRMISRTSLFQRHIAYRLSGLGNR